MTRAIEPGRTPADGAGSGARRALVLALGIAAGLALPAVLWIFARPLALVGLGVVIGEALRPVIDWGSRGLPRSLAVALVYLCLAAVMVALAWYALAPLAGQAEELITSLPSLIEQAEAWVQRQDQRVSGIAIIDTLGGQIQGLVERLFALPMTVVSSFFDVLLVTFLSLYWLLAAPQLGQFALSLFPQRHRGRAIEVQAELGRTVGGYVRGVGINIVLVTTLSYIGMRLIGLPFALIFAVIAGLLEAIPIVGAFVAGAIIVGFALSQGLQTALITLAFFVALQQLEGNVLTPLVMRSQTDVHPFLILVAIVLGGSVGGLLGVLVAIPVAGAVKVLTVEVIAPALRRYAGVR